jgi:hypothetical protein
MFIPSQKTSNEAVKNAIFDYLNLNRHKFDEVGNFDPTADRRDNIPPRLTRYRAGPVQEGDRSHNRPVTGATELSQTLSKASACAVEVLPELAIAGSLLGLGAGTIPKPFVTPGSAMRTSIASKYLAPLIPGKFPNRVWTPRFGNPNVFTKSIGRAVARWIPGLGWALLAHDAYRFGDCMLRDKEESIPVP